MSNRIIISNPLYDEVFRYLMDDLESATIIISTLLNQTIINLKPLSNDLVHIHKNTQAKDNNSSIELMRLDYSAEILNKDNTKELVTIELQKAKLRTDEIRFRKYIAENLKKTEQIIADEIDPKTKFPKVIEKTYRFIPIFILNFEIETEICDLVIQTDRNIHGVFTGKQLQGQNEFLDNLMYNLIVVQIPYINRISEFDLQDDKHKLALYKLFQLFNQSNPADRENHSLYINEDEIPVEYSRIVHRLANVNANDPQLYQKLILEDTALKEILEMQSDIYYYKENNLKQKLTILEKDKTIEQNNKTIEENNKTIEDNNKTIEQSILTLYKFIKDPQQIANELGIGVERVNRVLEKRL